MLPRVAVGYRGLPRAAAGCRGLPAVLYFWLSRAAAGTCLAFFAVAVVGLLLLRGLLARVVVIALATRLRAGPRSPRQPTHRAGRWADELKNELSFPKMYELSKMRGVRARRGS